MAITDTINRVLREFRRYTGDGLPDEPSAAPLPIGDPSSGVNAPKKSEWRALLTAVLDAAIASTASAAEAAAASAELAEDWADAAALVAVPNGSLTNAKLANMVQGTLKGRAAGAGTGVPTDLTPAQARALLNVAEQPVLARRNRHPNPAWQVSQESGNSAGTTNDFFPADFCQVSRITSGVITAQRVQVATPNGGTDRVRLTITTADASLAAGDCLMATTNFQGLQVADLAWGTAAAKAAVAVVGVKAPAGTYAVVFRNATDTRTFVYEFVIAGGQANADVALLIPIPAETLGTWRKDTGTGMLMSVVFAAGTDFQGVAGWQNGGKLGTASISNGMATATAVFEIFDCGFYPDPLATGIAPAWQHPDENAVRNFCKKFFETIFVPMSSILTVGMCTSTTVCRWVLEYAEKNATPTVAVPSTLRPLNSTGSPVTLSSIATTRTAQRTYVVMTAASGLVAGNAAAIFAFGDTTCTVDARLGVSYTGFMGDSLTVHLLTQYAWPHSINAGVGGNTTTQMAARFATDILNPAPAQTLIFGGVNDIVASVATATIVANIKTMADAAAAAGIRPVLVKIPPVGGSYASYNSAVIAFNAALQAMANGNGYAIIDLYTPFLSGGVQNTALFNVDLLHPNSTGIALEKSIIEPAMA